LRSSKAEGSYKVQITDAKLSLAAYTLSPEVIVAHNATLAKEPAIYPFVQTDVKMFSIAQGQFNHTTTNLFNIEIPFRVRVCFIKSEAINGKLSLNPLNLITADVSNLDLVWDGTSRARPAFQPDFEQNCYTQSYLSNYIANNTYDEWRGNDIPIQNYKKGFCMWTFNISGPYSKNYIPLPKYGILTLSANFKKALPQATTVIVIGDFHSNLKIDQVRNVVV
jgi:hypothetical protein